jgi:hypothetical protein
MTDKNMDEGLEYDVFAQSLHRPVSFQIHSDLHFERNPTAYGTYDIYRQGRFLLLPGDICRANLDSLTIPDGSTTHMTQYIKFIQRMAAKFDAVFYIASNTEYMGNGTESKSLSDFQTIQIVPERLNVKNTRGLHQETVDLEPLYGIAISVIGTTLWSNIRDDAPAGTEDTFPESNKGRHNERYEKEVAYLREAVKTVRQDRPNHRIIIMTHHAPTIRGSG